MAVFWGYKLVKGISLLALALFLLTNPELTVEITFTTRSSLVAKVWSKNFLLRPHTRDYNFIIILK